MDGEYAKKPLSRESGRCLNYFNYEHFPISKKFNGDGDGAWLIFDHGQEDDKNITVF